VLGGLRAGQIVRLRAQPTIENENADYFVDRDHSGKMTLTIG